MTKQILITIAIALTICDMAIAATTTINCSTASTVNSAISTASSGDTVQCNATGSYTWSSAVTLPATHYVTLDLNGSTITLSGASTELTLNAHATGSNRITNGKIVRGTGYNQYRGPFIINNNTKNYGTIVVDHLIFSGSYVLISAGGLGPALIHHCTFNLSNVNQETIHVENSGSWTDADSPGSANALYLEDNIFNGNSGTTADCAFQAYYGARTVARFNTVNSVMLEQHGTAGNEGARWWEFYKNTFTGDGFICLRAGSGIIFGNTGDTNIIMVEEDSGYPANYQIGRGQNQSLYPAYVWGNHTSSPNLNVTGCASPAANMVQLNRDVYVPTSGTTLPATCTPQQGYWKTNEGSWNQSGSGGQGVLYKCTSTNTWTAYYTPYIYPHPLANSIQWKTPAMPVIINVQ